MSTELKPVRKSGIGDVIPRRTQVTDLLLGESRVMLRWRSSLWKLLWKELIVYTVLFLCISFIYRYALDEAQQFEFERVVKWCGKQYTGLPLTFLLGFYVSLVVKRWWEQYCKLPWPDKMAGLLRVLVKAPDTEKGNEKAQIVRRTIIRYYMLSYVLCIRRLSLRLRKRFPTMTSVIKTGLVRKDEAIRIGDEDSHKMYGSNWWMPLKWCAEILDQAQVDGMIPNAPGYVNLHNELSTFRDILFTSLIVVTLAVYIYFIVSLIGEQYIIFRKEGDDLDLLYPIFTTVKFLFYFGWLRVAETLYNPFGEDDDDFELNELLNRHFTVAMRIVSTAEPPPVLLKDIYFSDPEPILIESDRDEESMLEHMNGKDTLTENIDLNSDEERSPLQHTVSNCEKTDPRAGNA